MSEKYGEQLALFPRSDVLKPWGFLNEKLEEAEE